MSSITPFLWFDTEAEEAARFYTSLFPNSRITEVARYGDPDREKAQRAMAAMLQMKKIDIAEIERAAS